MSTAWVGVIYLGIGMIGILSSGNLIKVMMSLLLMSWGGVLTVLLLGVSPSEVTLQASALMSLLAGVPAFVAGLSLLIRRRLRGRSLDNVMKELRN